jgi:hypothetical protein
MNFFFLGVLFNDYPFGLNRYEGDYELPTFEELLARHRVTLEIVSFLTVFVGD